LFKEMKVSIRKKMLEADKLILELEMKIKIYQHMRLREN